MSTVRPLALAGTLLFLGAALTPSFADLAQPDRDFASWAAHDNISEIQDAQYVTPSYKPASVNTLAQKIIKDRTAALATLKTVAHDGNFSLPDKASPEEKQARASIDSQPATTQAHPANTQRAQTYVSYEIKHLQEEVDRFQAEIASGTDAQLKQYAQKYLPVIQDELHTAQSINLTSG